MKPLWLRSRLVTCALLGLGAFTARGQAVDASPYAWEFPAVAGVSGADGLVTELQSEIQRVLDAGRLAPLYLSFADQESVGYTVYQEPGRIITTLAWAYPYLTPAQQTAARAYVNAEFSNPTNAPWGVTAYGRNGNSNFPLPHSAGTPREDHPKERWWYPHADFGNARPFLHTLYGVWLYGHRTSDWTAISNHWAAIKTLYNNHGTADAYRLYGTMGVHIAVLRLADRFGDTAMRTAALNNLQSRLDAGLSFDAVETYARGTPGNEWRSPYGSYPSMYDPRMDSSTYHGWVFLNLTPEIGRYLHDADAALRTQVLARHAAGKDTFPLWWLPKASYFNRSWTGDEGSGLVPEVVGMIAPVERWVVQADAAALKSQMRGAPNGKGDCYWLEALVQAIEAHGVVRWADVRRAPPRLHDARFIPEHRLRVGVTGSLGQTCIVQRSNDLTTWNDLSTNASPFDFTTDPALDASRFFRAR
jgi:hypothetical protein